MEYKYIIFDIIDKTARITLNRPDVLNSFNSEMAREVQDALDKSATNNDIRCLIITAAGKAFCAGQDLEEVSKPDINLGDIVKTSYNPIIMKIRELGKPVIASVNGIAAGAGANLALACDLVIASKKASFIQAFSKIGLIPDSGGTFFLPRLVGLARAASMMMLAEKITADKAVEFGMIYLAVEHEELTQRTLELAGKLADLPTKGLALTKQALNNSFDCGLKSQLDYEEELQRQAGATHDYNEGIAAFLEKRKPEFRGE